MVKTSFPHPVREIENTWIPVSDGARLAARIWLPADAAQNPIPAILECIPYRKSDYTPVRDALRQPYFAGHGYAVVRVDLRGSGDSDGILSDEYLPQEQDDIIDVIHWLAAQPWCDGNVGMTGISWGGFNSLQVAARRPAPLKAILVIGASDDRYNDDVHYMGGCLLTSQMLPWSAVMLVANAAPPDPRWVGQRWREMWFERMEQSLPFVETWLRHQRKDAYWQHGSVSQDYSQIQVPVYIVGGWADTYNNSVPRLLAGLSCPRKGLIGPWVHTFPEMGEPKPAIGFLQESLRWWDYWLKGIDTGIMDEPMLRSYIQESVPPATYYETRNGRWVADPVWPSPYVSEQVFPLLARETAKGQGRRQKSFLPSSFFLLPSNSVLRIQGRQDHGLAAGEWGAYGSPGEWPGEQRGADGESLTFTSRPLEAPLDILGRPGVDLVVSVDRPLALVAVRLCDVAPDGASTLVSWGLLNLAHRHGHNNPQPLTPGKPYVVTVSLNMIGYQIPAGHHLRLAISPTYFRHAWPSPQPVTLTLHLGKRRRQKAGAFSSFFLLPSSFLRLPLRKPQPTDSPESPFPPPETAPPLPAETLRPANRRQWVEQDAINGKTTLTIENDDGRIHYPHGLEVDSRSVETQSVVADDPLSMFHRVQHTAVYQRSEWQVRIETDSTLTADAAHFYVTNHLNAYEGHVRVFSKSWTARIERDHL